jgi:Right handed beta helix region
MARTPWLLLLTLACSSKETVDRDGGGPDGPPASGADAGPVDPPDTVCDAPLALYPTTGATVIGNGTAASCTEALLRPAAEAGGIITFDCGPDPVTIALTSAITLPVDKDTILDGGGKVILDAGEHDRHFFFEHPAWMDNPHKVVLQRLTFRHGKAPAGTYFPQDPDRPKCAYGYKEGSGGVIYMRNGVLHVIDSVFEDNQAALVGPDVGGGAIYALGVPEVIITGSTFARNRGSNGGAVGLLFAGRVQVVNTTFDGNRAEGVGANYVEDGCPEFNHDEQGGAGGNGGGFVFDGLNDEGAVTTFCGTTFHDNRANALAGAIFRTPNAGVRDLRIDRSTFDGNTGKQGGVSFIKQNRVVVRASTFLHNRSGVDITGAPSAGGAGGLWVNEGELDLENSTFFDNSPSGLDVEGTGTVRNATFMTSRPSGGVTLRNSVFVDANCNGTRPGDHNLQWPMGGMACAQGTTYADPMLGTIGNHGGVAPTFLPTGAVGGVGADCPTTDQRGESRTTATCAAGAVEP